MYMYGNVLELFWNRLKQKICIHKQDIIAKSQISVTYRSVCLSKLNISSLTWEKKSILSCCKNDANNNHYCEFSCSSSKWYDIWSVQMYFIMDLIVKAICMHVLQNNKKSIRSVWLYVWYNWCYTWSSNIAQRCNTSRTWVLVVCLGQITYQCSQECTSAFLYDCCVCLWI